MSWNSIAQPEFVATNPVTDPALRPNNDEWLVAQAKEQRHLFAELYDRHLTGVYRYLLAKVGNVSDAEDLASQTFLQALENLDQYRGDGQFRAWLFRIARNKSVDFYRERRNLIALEEDADFVDDSLPSADESAEESWQHDQILKKLRMLAADRAEAISLFFVAGLEISEVAVAMNRKEPAVRMLLHRGLRDLRARMNPVPVESMG